MPTTALESFVLNTLQPFQNPEDARTNAVAFGPSLVIKAGTAIAKKTSDQKCYALVAGASDGTQLGVGFSLNTFATDAAGLVYFNGGVASPTASTRTPAFSTSAIYESGTFSQNDLFSAATQVAEVDTYTPGGTITTGDVDTLTYTAPDSNVTTITFTVGATTTATAVSAGLIAAWNANTTTAAIATASGTSTVVLTGKNAGRAFTVASSVTGVGTLTRAATTAASGAVIADIIAAFAGSRILTNGAVLIP